MADSCKEAGVELLYHFGVKRNPTAEHAAPAIALCKKEKPDVIIALGGGSAMDEDKFIGVGALYDGDPWDFPLGKAVIEKTIPVITVVTIPATSSELNGTAVITNEALGRKDGFVNPVMKPVVSILDPELTYTIPVSYTHLDVYKRQGFHCAQKLGGLGLRKNPGVVPQANHSGFVNRYLAILQDLSLIHI